MAVERTVVCRTCAGAFVSSGPNTQWCSRECAFVSQVKVGEGCHEWVGKNVNTSGYGMLSFRSKIVLAHRYAYERKHGAIPEGQFICHHCDNPLCCNSEHLFAGTAKENHEDMVRKGRNAHHPGPPTLRGSASGKAKLREADVRAIRSSSERAPQLARRYGVNDTAIHKIRRRQTWKHI